MTRLVGASRTARWPPGAQRTNDDEGTRARPRRGSVFFSEALADPRLGHHRGRQGGAPARRDWQAAFTGVWPDSAVQGCLGNPIATDRPTSENPARWCYSARAHRTLHLRVTGGHGLHASAPWQLLVSCLAVLIDLLTIRHVLYGSA